MPVLMRSSEGTGVEVFEWKSREAIQQAHSNTTVIKLWERFAEVCDFEIPVNVKNSKRCFLNLKALNSDFPVDFSI
jgi:hypothetical protein